MENIHQLESWRDLYVMLGTSAAALIGLLYVVTSLHLKEIVNNAVYRARARSNSLYLLIMLVEAALILTPQPILLLGIELAAVNLFGLWLNGRNIYRLLYDPEISKRGGMKLYRALTFTFGFLLGIAGGVCLIKGLVWGSYLVTASYLTLLVFVALNAWAIMLGVGQAEEKGKANRATTQKRQA
jgi:hypothetical protein